MNTTTNTQAPPASDPVPARVSATYALQTRMDPHRAAEIIAGEQSSGTFVPIPGEDAALKARALASYQIHAMPEQADGTYLLELSWPLSNLGASLPNLLATVAGNLYELKPVESLRLLDISLPDEFAAAYPGPAEPSDAGLPQRAATEGRQYPELVRDPRPRRDVAASRARALGWAP